MSGLDSTITCIFQRVVKNSDLDSDENKSESESEEDTDEDEIDPDTEPTAERKTMRILFNTLWQHR